MVDIPGMGSEEGRGRYTRGGGADIPEVGRAGIPGGGDGVDVYTPLHMGSGIPTPLGRYTPFC